MTIHDGSGQQPGGVARAASDAGGGWVACLWACGDVPTPDAAANTGSADAGAERPATGIGAASDAGADAGRSDAASPLTVALLALARECSPRVEVAGPSAVVVDASGVTRLFGGPRGFAEHVARAAGERGLRVSVAVAATRSAAMLLARAAAGGVVVVPRGREASAVAALPIGVLAEVVRTFAAGDAMPDEAATSAPHRRASRLPARHYRIAPPPDASSGASPPPPGRTGGPPPLPGDHPVSPSSRGAAVTAAPAAPVRTGARSGRAAPDLLPTLERWGLRTVGDVAALPAADLHARLGDEGLRWRRWARGEDDRPLVRAPEDERFEASMALEWPIDGLEPLSFVLARVLEPLCAHLERRDRAAAVLHVWLRLVTRTVHHRALTLPVPMRDPKVLRTLLLLDLESHPPDAGIDAVTVAADPAPGRIVHYSLLARPLPSPDQVSTLVARLTALMGEGRCGAPALVDTHRPGAFAMTAFAPVETMASPLPGPPPVPARSVLRRMRYVLVATVTVERSRPVRVTTCHAALPGGAVTCAAGPWRTSGEWWQPATAAGAPARAADGSWDRDEWDVTLADGAAYRLHRDRVTDRWYVDGVWD